MTFPTPDGVMTRPIGLDFTAVMMVANARGVDGAMLADILPRIEAAIVNAISADDLTGDPADGKEDDHGDENGRLPPEVRRQS